MSTPPPRNPGDGEESEPRHGQESMAYRARTALGLSSRQWTWFVSLLMFVPYPVFIWLYLTYPIDESVFLAITVLFSVAIAVLSFYT